MKAINKFLQEAKFTIDVERFEAIYDHLDEGHDREHVRRVRGIAVRLAEKHDPEKVLMAYVAATCHDMGLIKGREGHEAESARMLLRDKQLKEEFTPDERKQMAHAVAQHRASTGQPKTILAKIISDADRSAVTTSYSLYRGMAWGIRNDQESGDPIHPLDWQIKRAVDHHSVKYKPGGLGRRVYFPETDKIMERVFAPVMRAHANGRIEEMWKLITPSHKKKIDKLYKKYGGK